VQPDSSRADAGERIDHQADQGDRANTGRLKRSTGSSGMTNEFCRRTRRRFARLLRKASFLSRYLFISKT
jgi:hypothetical protein